MVWRMMWCVRRTRDKRVWRCWTAFRKCTKTLLCFCLLLVFWAKQSWNWNLKPIVRGEQNVCWKCVHGNWKFGTATNETPFLGIVRCIEHPSRTWATRILGQWYHAPLASNSVAFRRCRQVEANKNVHQSDVPTRAPFAVQIKYVNGNVCQLTEKRLCRIACNLERLLN